MTPDQSAWQAQVRAEADRLYVTILSNHKMRRDDRENLIADIERKLAALGAVERRT